MSLQVIPSIYFSPSITDGLANSALLDRLLVEHDEFVLPAMQIPIARAFVATKTNQVITMAPGGALMCTMEKLPVTILGKNVTMAGVKVVAAPGQQRGHQRTDCGFVVEATAIGTKLFGCETIGAAGAGFMNFGSKHLYMDGCRSIDSKADGVHHTFGAHHAEVVRHECVGNGDDYYSVVSYVNEEPTTHIEVRNSTGRGQVTTGRALTVIGGEHVLYRGLKLYGAMKHGININSEANGAQSTHGSTFVTLLDILMNGSGLGVVTDPAARWPGMVVGGREGFPTTDVTAKGVIIKNAHYGIKQQIRNSAFTARIDLAGVI